LQPIETGESLIKSELFWIISSHIIRANAFKVNVSALSVKVYHYHVSIFRYDRENNLREEDLAKEKDTTMNIGIVKQVISEHKEWKLNDRTNDTVGLAYDGRSSLYSTALLPLPHNSDGHAATFDVTYPPNTPNNYFLRFLWWKNGEVEIPRTDDAWRERPDQVALQVLDSSLVSFARWHQSEIDPQWILSGNKSFAQMELFSTLVRLIWEDSVIISPRKLACPDWS
jgi:hypothetical protein